MTHHTTNKFTLQNNWSTKQKQKVSLFTFLGIFHSVYKIWFATVIVLHLLIHSSIHFFFQLDNKNDKITMLKIKVCWVNKSNLLILLLLIFEWTITYLNTLIWSHLRPGVAFVVTTNVRNQTKTKNHCTICDVTALFIPLQKTFFQKIFFVFNFLKYYKNKKNFSLYFPFLCFINSHLLLFSLSFNTYTTYFNTNPLM